MVVDDTGSSKCELISLRQLSLNTGDICQLLFNSVSEFSFVRSKRGLDAIDGWVPSKSIQITDISLSSGIIISKYDFTTTIINVACCHKTSI